MGWPVPCKGFGCCQPLGITRSPLARGEVPCGGTLGSSHSAPQASPRGQLLTPCHASLAALTSHRPPVPPNHTQVSGGVLRGRWPWGGGCSTTGSEMLVKLTPLFLQLGKTMEEEFAGSASLENRFRIR